MGDKCMTILFAVAAAALLVLLIYNRKRTYDRLNNILTTGTIREYLEMLDDKFVKMTLTDKERLVMKLDAYLLLRDNAGAETVIKQLDVASFGKADRVTYYQKRLNHYVAANNVQEAEKSYSMLCQSIEMAGGGAQLEAVKAQAKLMLDVFVHRDVSRIEELKGLETQQEDSPAKGMTRYLLARLYYAKGEEGMARDYARKASTLLEGTPWGAVACAVLEDISLLGQ